MGLSNNFVVDLHFSWLIKLCKTQPPCYINKQYLPHMVYIDGKKLLLPIPTMMMTTTLTTDT